MSPCCSKRKLNDKGLKDASESERDSFSPKRRRGKQVHYFCRPCGMDLNSWCLIRKHLLSSEHLQAVSKHRRKQINLLKWKRPPRLSEPPLTTNTSPSAEQVWDGGVCAASPKELLMAGLDLVKVGKGCEERNGPPPPQPYSRLKNHCSVPVEPLAVPEAPGYIEGASESAHVMSHEVGLASVRNGYGTLAEDLRSDSLENSGCQVSPKKFILQKCQRSTQQLPLLDVQRSTFVRIDYNKKSSGPGVRDPGFGSRDGRGRLFEHAYIEETAYSCVAVKPGELPQPYVNMGDRCDSESFRTAVDPGAVELISLASGAKRKPPRSPYRRIRLSIGGRADEMPMKEAKKMIRIDYCQKSSLVSSERPTTAGSLTYIGPADQLERASESSSPIHSLVDEEALGERLYLSESDDDKDVDLDNVIFPSLESGEDMYILDSERFLKLLVMKLNDGGFCCQRCGNHVDGNSVMAQLYTCMDKAQSPGTHCSEKEVMMS